MIAISTDRSEESAKFARDYEINFPLLADLDGAVSRAYVGVNYDGTTIPGVVVIRRDGVIVFRQIATAKDDRLSREALLDTIDRTLGTSGARTHSGYPTFERVQLHLDGGGGARDRDHGATAIGVVSLGLLYPLGRQVLVGPWLGTNLTSAIDLDVAAAVRLPLLHDVGAIQLTLTAGWSPVGAASWNAGGRIGPWLAVSPTWALHLDLGVTTRGLHERELFATFGLTRLLRVR